MSEKFKSLGEVEKMGDQTKLSLGICVTLGFLMGYMTGKVVEYNRSRSDIANIFYPIKDLNRDGFDDLFGETSNGHKTPLYAVVKKDGTIYYVNADEYKKTHPSDIMDYEKIEDMLNKKINL